MSIGPVIVPMLAKMAAGMILAPAVADGEAAVAVELAAAERADMSVRWVKGIGTENACNTFRPFVYHSLSIYD
jgi:hypothetical protein